MNRPIDPLTRKMEVVRNHLLTQGFLDVTVKLDPHTDLVQFHAPGNNSTTMRREDFLARAEAQIVLIVSEEMRRSPGGFGQT